MTGVSHTKPAGTSFALRLMKRLRLACDTWKLETGIGFGLYGTPAESLCYRFAEIDKKTYLVFQHKILRHQKKSSGTGFQT